jgi:uncharacterized protein YhbP (UPF0306 family)
LNASNKEAISLKSSKMIVEQFESKRKKYYIKFGMRKVSKSKLWNYFLKRGGIFLNVR